METHVAGVHPVAGLAEDAAARSTAEDLDSTELHAITTVTSNKLVRVALVHGMLLAI